MVKFFQGKTVWIGNSRDCHRESQGASRQTLLRAGLRWHTAPQHDRGSHHVAVHWWMSLVVFGKRAIGSEEEPEL